MNISGCTTTCMHCWAQGRFYDFLPIEDIKWVQEGIENFSNENGFEGKIDATARKLAKQKFHDVLNKKMVSFHERTIYEYYMNYKKRDLMV